MPKTFTDELRDLQRGALVEECTEKLAALVQAVAATGKPGKFVLELGVKRASKGSAALTVTSAVKVKAPDEDAENETLMFATPEGSLLTEDPRQSRLDLKVAPAPSADALKVASPT